MVSIPKLILIFVGRSSSKMGSIGPPLEGSRGVVKVIGGVNFFLFQYVVPGDALNILSYCMTP